MATLLPAAARMRSPGHQQRRGRVGLRSDRRESWPAPPYPPRLPGRAPGPPVGRFAIGALRDLGQPYPVRRNRRADCPVVQRIDDDLADVKAT